MNFHLNHTPPKLPAAIDHSQKLLTIGSCFAGTIGTHFLDLKFNCLINPNGILFNPASIAAALESYISDTDPGGQIVQHNGRYSHLNYHGDFNYGTEEELNKAIRFSRQQAHQQLRNSQWLIVTFGTAFVYRHLKSDQVVANCHKLPQSDFRKELLRSGSIVQQYLELIAHLKIFNPGLKIIFTVSPVKYLRDGLVENNLSKAILIQSVHEIVNSAADCFYFPAYELVHDDLRDYRFYKADLAHPSDQAIAYTWEKFSNSAFTETTRQLNEKIKEVLAAASHRPIHPESVQHQKFKADYLEKCRLLETEFPFLDLGKEKKYFSE